MSKELWVARGYTGDVLNKPLTGQYFVIDGSITDIPAYNEHDGNQIGDKDYYTFKIVSAQFQAPANPGESIYGFAAQKWFKVIVSDNFQIPAQWPAADPVKPPSTPTTPDTGSVTVPYVPMAYSPQFDDEMYTVNPYDPGQNLFRFITDGNNASLANIYANRNPDTRATSGSRTLDIPIGNQFVRVPESVARQSWDKYENAIVRQEIDRELGIPKPSIGLPSLPESPFFKILEKVDLVHKSLQQNTVGVALDAALNMLNNPDSANLEAQVDRIQDVANSFKDTLKDVLDVDFPSPFKAAQVPSPVALTTAEQKYIDFLGTERKAALVMATTEKLYAFSESSATGKIDMQIASSGAMFSAQRSTNGQVIDPLVTNAVDKTHSAWTIIGSIWGDAIDRNNALTNDRIHGGQGDDILRGGYGLDELLGGTGSDTLEGGDGYDKLDGGDGDDCLIVAADGGSYRGGFGRDEFAFAGSGSKANAARISDYNSFDDTIIIDAENFDLRSGWVERDAFVVGNKAKDAQDHLIYNSKRGMLYFDPDGTGRDAKELIAIFDNRPKLKISDFFASNVATADYNAHLDYVA